ncbi:GTPase IMAP family member 8-like [Xyrichtys novacula]|uniref:GTPase IMAP family member 8-like n=1 Tax=Xyrichtys novacula TaxID=13765 RepID=A0AAV1FYA1_XYRNO|nr:GTPase IMAP family member 8-like [Xyrichtys novacula]
MLLLGERKSGKSSAGNTILGRPAFTKNTTHSTREIGTIFRKQVTVVDTPGWSPNSTTPHRVSQDVCTSLTLCKPELHAILLVLPTTSAFGKEEWRAMEDHLRLLQTPIWSRAMVLFTHGDKLGVPIEEHIRQQGKTLHWLLERCANRYHVMTNQPSTIKAEVTQLMEKIQRMLETTPPSWEIRNKQYTKLRQESMEGWRGWQGRQEDMEMTNVYDLCDDMPGLARQRASGKYVLVCLIGPGCALSFILLGRKKSGKSSAGNIILNREKFQVHQYRQTSKSSVGHGTVSGRAVTVVLTPGWSLFGLSNVKEVKAEIEQSPSYCPEGSKVTFLLAIPVDTFKRKDMKAVEEFVGVLGNDVWRRTVVLFTYGEELRGTTVEEHIKKKGEPLQAVLQKCYHRRVVFNTESGDSDQVKQLLEIVDPM